MKSILHNLYQLQTMDLGGSSGKASEMEALRAGIPQGMLSNYDRARARGRKGIALLRNQVCTSCRMKAPIAVLAALKGGAIQVCGNCGLYLCLDPNEQAPIVVPEPPAPAKRKKRVALAK